MSLADVRRLGLPDYLGEQSPAGLVTVKAGEAEVTLPVVPSPGQKPGTIAIALGYGRGANGEKVGKAAVVTDRNRHYTYSALPSPDHLLVIAAGGEAGGFAAVIPPWLGPKSAAATAAIGVCIDC